MSTPSMLNCQYDQPFVDMQMTRCESFVGHIRELPDGFSRGVKHQNVGILKGLKGEFKIGRASGRERVW